MNVSRAAVSIWYWEGGPLRRFLVSLAVTALILVVPYLAGSPTSGALIMMFVGFDLGSWFMDKVHVDRLMRRKIVAG
ncbi:MAG: hypothetical protein H0W63_09350 [Gemmatimonadaceae bacterium]|nr:hypothetical protein [Gemmatimonadaceae bacterium]